MAKLTLKPKPMDPMERLLPTRSGVESAIRSLLADPRYASRMQRPGRGGLGQRTFWLIEADALDATLRGEPLPE